MAGASSEVLRVKLVCDIISGVLDLVYPPYCLVCGQAGEDYLCPECIEKIDIIEQPFCRKCGIPCESYHCTTCRERNFEFKCSCSAGTFDSVLRKAIHLLKYDFRQPIADPLANLMVRCFPNTHLSGCVDVAVPVPIHRSRMLERGFNQAEELARGFCKKVSLPLETRSLRKHRETRHQVDLPHAERAVNVQGAFAVANPGPIAGKRVLLIDDVFTTGSTLSESAKTLKSAGAAEVYAYTLARSL